MIIRSPPGLCIPSLRKCAFPPSLAHASARLPAHVPPRAPAARKPPHASRIHVVHANPVIVAVNPRARDLVELFQLASADLADLPFGNLDLGIVTENYNHSPHIQWSRAIKLSGVVHVFGFS